MSTPFEFMKSCKYSASAIKLYNHDLPNVMGSLNDYRLVGKYVDVTIDIRGSKSPVYAHSAILAAHSTVFDAMLSIDMREARTRHIDMTVYDPDCVIAILDYMYIHTITIASRNVIGLFELAHVFDLRYISNTCIDFIMSSLNTDNLDCIAQFIDMANITGYKKNIMQYVKKHLSSVSVSRVFLELSYVELTRVLTSNSYHHKYDKRHAIDRLVGLLNYIEYDIDNRKHHNFNLDILNIPFVPRGIRAKLLDDYPSMRQKLSDLFDALPVVNDFDAYSSESKLVSVTLNFANTRIEDAVVVHSRKNRKYYEYMTDIEIYCTNVIQNNGIKLQSIIGLLLKYDSEDKIQKAGICDDRYYIDKIHLSVEQDERVTDITICRYDIYICSITFTTSLNITYGPYGMKNISDDRIRNNIQVINMKPLISPTGRCYLLNMSTCYLLYMGRFIWVVE